jgi:hypothetical protein
MNKSSVKETALLAAKAEAERLRAAEDLKAEQRAQKIARESVKGLKESNKAK